MAGRRQPIATIGFAHRGASAHAQENTLEAFALALEMGARALESDVWLTADGCAVLDHDGEVGGVPMARVQSADLPAFVPALSELYAECGSDFEISLDVKDHRAGPEVIRVARAAGAEGRLWLCHWNWKKLLPWRAASARVHLVDSTRLSHMRTPVGERAVRMRKLGIDALSLHHEEWTKEFVDALHELDRRAFAWDLQEIPALRKALALGVDAVYSDHVDRMRTALDEQEERAQ